MAIRQLSYISAGTLLALGTSYLKTDANTVINNHEIVAINPPQFKYLTGLCFVNVNAIANSSWINLKKRLIRFVLWPFLQVVVEGDENGSFVSPGNEGKQGELQVRGPSVFKW